MSWQLPYTKTTSKTSGRITGRLLSMCIGATLHINPVKGEFSDFSYVQWKKIVLFNVYCDRLRKNLQLIR